MKFTSCAPVKRIRMWPRASRPGSFGSIHLLPILLLCVAGSHNALGAPPANDLCAGAETIEGAGPFPFFSTITQDISDATTDGDPDSPSCGATTASRSVWYEFTPVEDGLYTFSVGQDTATTVADTVMALYVTDSDCAGELIELNCNDDAATTQSAFEIDLAAGETYYVLVWHYYDTPPVPPSGTAVQLKVARPQAPPNDTCIGAIVIPPDGPFPYLTEAVDTFLAGTADDPPEHDCKVSYHRSVWFEFTPERSGQYSISTCRDTVTTVFDTLVAVYASADACAGPLTPVGCDDNGCSDLRGVVVAALAAGTTYSIVVWDYEEEPIVSETDVQLKITIPPEAETLPATDISSAGATINGVVRPNGMLTRFWFEYGTNTVYGERGPLRLLFGTEVEAVTNHVVTAIAPDQVYHYRVVATNENGMAFGEDRMFVYSTTPPSIDAVADPGTGPFQLQFNAAANQIYRVSASTNLLEWEDIGPAETVGEGVFLFRDETITNFPRRFYRVISP